MAYVTQDQQYFNNLLDQLTKQYELSHYDHIPPAVAQPACNHSFVNVGFMHLKLVCKHCDKEKGEN